MGVNLPAVDLGTDRRALKIAVGNAHSCALLDDGAIKCWGANGSGELGLGDTVERGSEPGQMGNTLNAVDLGTSAVVVNIAAAGSHTCALFEAGQVKCWGTNYFGELGLGDTATRGDEASDMGAALGYLNLGAGAVARGLVTGQNHTCVLMQDRRVKCWGDNTNGRLGLGDTANRGDAAFELGDSLAPLNLGAVKVRTLAAHGGSHSCVVLENGQVKCWGDNGFGALGLGDLQDRGGDPRSLGDQLLSVDLGGQRALAIEAGSGTTCAILQDGTARCWGYNQYATLGTGDTRNRGDTASSLGTNLTPVDLGEAHHATAIRLGSGNHTCALLEDGALKCWGSSGRGQLGQGHGNTIGDEAGEMGDSLPAVDLRSF